MLSFFLGKAFGVLRLHGGYPFMFGQWHGGRFLLVKTLSRGFMIVSWCCLCRCSGKVVDHLLIHCTITLELWSVVFRSFGI